MEHRLAHAGHLALLFSLSVVAACAAETQEAADAGGESPACGDGTVPCDAGPAECDPGYAGLDCSVCDVGYVMLSDHACVADPCTPGPCGDHGECTADDQTGAARCLCEEGFAGARCDACAEGAYPVGDRCLREILFALPVVNSDSAPFNPGVIGFDHDPEPGWSDADCTDYQGRSFPYCYDDHSGSDFILTDGFAAMDAGSAAVVAAAAGEVIETHDGEFDRCRADLESGGIVCPGYQGVTPANYVKLAHADGRQTWYWHLKKDSVAVSVGDQVECGDVLGLVGSSGRSSTPHLHFTVVDADGVKVDPFAGPWSQLDSMWVLQEGPDGLPGASCQ